MTPERELKKHKSKRHNLNSRLGHRFCSITVERLLFVYFWDIAAQVPTYAQMTPERELNKHKSKRHNINSRLGHRFYPTAIERLPFVYL